jgi:hypothetical protein
MKKVILSLVVVAALSTACKKNYTCTCTVGGTGGLTTSTTFKATKSTATSDCNALSNSTNSVSCAIQ